MSHPFLLISHSHLQRVITAVMEHNRTQLPGFGLPINCYMYQQHGANASPSSLNQDDMIENRTV